MQVYAIPESLKSTLPAPAQVQQLHHYAYRARDAEETRSFYEDVLGLPMYHIIQSDVVPSTGEYCPYTHFSSACKTAASSPFLIWATTRPLSPARIRPSGSTTSAFASTRCKI